MALVSIIIPCFNHAKYLKLRIESILSQTIKDFEIFILDDCSTDNSWEIIQEYAKNPKVKYTHKNDQNSGSPFIQWQKGIEMASGEYIWIAESDDYSEPDFLEKNLTVLNSDLSIGISFCPSIWVDSENNILEKPEHESTPFISEGESIIMKDFTSGCLIYNASSAIFRKNLVQNIDFQLVKQFKFTGDWLFWVQLIKNTKLSRIGDRLNYFRRHTENVSSKSNKIGLQFSEGFKVVNYIFKNHKIGFFGKQKIYLKWAIKVANNNDIEPDLALAHLPIQVKIWYKLLPIISIFR